MRAYFSRLLVFRFCGGCSRVGFGWLDLGRLIFGGVGILGECGAGDCEDAEDGCFGFESG